MAFDKFEVISADQIEAQKLDSPFLLDGTQYQAGDYLIKGDDGSLKAMHAKEFDSKYRKVKKTWSRKKKVEGDGEATVEATEGETLGEAQAATASEVVQ